MDKKHKYIPEPGDLFIDDDGDLGLEGPDGVRYILTVAGGMVRPLDVGPYDSTNPVRRVANVLDLAKGESDG